MASNCSPAINKRKDDNDSGNRASSAKKGHWSVALSEAINDESVQLYKDDLCTVIKDKYPKARIHLLVMPNEHISDVKSLNNTHVTLLKHMLKVGKEVAEKTAVKLNAHGLSAYFRYGYHAIPSMALLHMHVISQDFTSDSFKTKKHWNSFTTDFFLDASEVIDGLQANGYIRINRERMQKLLEQPLKCHRCSSSPKTIPMLKQHLQAHNAHSNADD